MPIAIVIAIGLWFYIEPTVRQTVRDWLDEQKERMICQKRSDTNTMKTMMLRT